MSKVMDKPVTREQHTIALARLHAQPCFNPRTKRDREKYARLASSVRRKGVLQPILVAPHPNIDGEYVIVAGESRYLAACDASLTEIPCVLDVPDEETGGLEDALIENMIRDDLSPLDEARAFQRLRDLGLSIKEIARRLTRSPKFIRERLQLLVLPDEVQRKIEKGQVPLTAVAALVQLAEMHPELPTIAVAKILNAPSRPSYVYHRRKWADLAEDPIDVVLAPGYDMELPDDVYPGGGDYGLGCFTLSKKAERDLAKLLEIAVPSKRDDIRVTFGRQLVEQAITMQAAHVSPNGHVLLIGQDIADQLAGDAIALMLKEAQSRERAVVVRLRREAAGDAGSAPTDPDAERKAKAAEERELEKVARRKALAHNEALGAAAIQALGKIKVDVRVLKILSAIDFGANLNDIAARGARYCLPYECWRQRRRLESGAVKIEMIEATRCAAPAREWLEGAHGQAGYAGRLLTLAVLARFADENALPRSRRALYNLAPGRDLPWSSEVIELIDDIAGELLPEHLTERVLDARRAKQQQIEDAQALVDRALADASTLTEQERNDVREAPYTVHGFTDAAHELCRQVDAALDAVKNEPLDDETDPVDGDEAPANENIDAGADEMSAADAESAGA